MEEEYKKAVSEALVLSNETKGDYTFEDLPNINLLQFCSIDLGLKNSKRTMIGDKAVYACNLSTYPGGKQIPGDYVTEITEIDDPATNSTIVSIRDKAIVSDSELSMSDLATTKSITFKAVRGARYDPKYEGICWRGFNDPKIVLCIDEAGRIILTSEGSEEKIPVDLTHIEDIHDLVAELRLGGFRDRIHNLYDIIKITRDSAERATGMKQVEANYLGGINEAVSPSTRLKKYTNEPWSEIKIQPIERWKKEGKYRRGPKVEEHKPQLLTYNVLPVESHTEEIAPPPVPVLEETAEIPEGALTELPKPKYNKHLPIEMISEVVEEKEKKKPTKKEIEFEEEYGLYKM